MFRALSGLINCAATEQVGAFGFILTGSANIAPLSMGVSTFCARRRLWDLTWALDSNVGASSHACFNVYQHIQMIFKELAGGLERLYANPSLCALANLAKVCQDGSAGIIPKGFCSNQSQWASLREEFSKQKRRPAILDLLVSTSIQVDQRYFLHFFNAYFALFESEMELWSIVSSQVTIYSHYLWIFLGFSWTPTSYDHW